MGRLFLISFVLVAGFCLALPVAAQTETPTATPTETPTPTITPTPVPTATPMPTPAAGAYYVNLPSGGVGIIRMEITAGEAMTTAGIMVLAAISTFRALQQLTQSARAK